MDNNNIPVVSVVIPVYNVEKYIESTLTCFKNQTFNDWELLLVDDLSTDSTVKLIEPFLDDSRMQLIKRNVEPKGAQTCRNIGINKASGKYIIVFDSDDLIESCCLEQRVEYMERHKELDYAVFKGQSFVINNDGKMNMGKKWGEETDKDILSCFLKAQYPFAVWNNIYKAEVVKNNLFDDKIHVYQDFDFIVRLLLKNYKFAFDNNSQVDYLYRQGIVGSISSVFITKEKYESTKYLFTKTLNSISKNPQRDVYIKSFYNFFILQYERVLLNGTKEQIYDFSDYFSDKYKVYSVAKKNILLKWLSSEVETTPEKRNRKKILTVLYLVLTPKRILRVIKNKLIGQ